MSSVVISEESEPAMVAITIVEFELETRPGEDESRA